MKKWGLALAAILALAALLRIRGLSFGLPAVYNPDRIATISAAPGCRKVHLHPQSLLHPTLSVSAPSARARLYFTAGHPVGAIASRAAFQRSFFVNPTGTSLAGRTL